MTIFIQKGTDHGAWYARWVGRTLPVEKFEVLRDPSQGIPEDVYWCREGGTYNCLNYVRASDAKVVSHRFIDQDEVVLLGDEWTLRSCIDTDPDGCWFPVEQTVGFRLSDLTDGSIVVRRRVDA